MIFSVAQGFPNEHDSAKWIATGNRKIFELHVVSRAVFLLLASHKCGIVSFDDTETGNT